MDCAKAAELIEQRRLGERVDDELFGQARDHIFMCGCAGCEQVKRTLHGPTPQVSIGQTAPYQA